MRRRSSYSTSPNQLFLLEIATLGLRRALRPFLHPTKPPFVAALVLPRGATQQIYVDAANELFATDRKDSEYRDGFCVIFIDNADKKKEDLERAFKNAVIFRSTLFFLTVDCDLPEEFRLAIDLFGVMPPPTAEQVMASTRKLGLGAIARKDAEFLAGIAPSRLRAAMTVGRPLASVVARLRAAKDEPPPVSTGRPHPDSSQLNDLIGFGELKAWGAQLARDLAGWESGALSWSEIDRGAVLFGPPGTGKTKAAEALAAASGMNFFKTSAARWQAKGHLGDFLKAMRSDFAEATKKAPCLMFLEELDSLGHRDFDTRDNEYTRKVVNGVLEAVDDALAREGVVIVGATNMVEAIDPALLRSGRIERIFKVEHPTPSERVSMLALHLRPHELELTSPHIRLVSEGMSGADLEKIARNAKRRAREEGRVLVLDDVMACLPSIRSLDMLELERVAVHEAGHAFVGVKLLSAGLVGVSISDTRVLERPGQAIGKTVFERTAKGQKVASEYRDEIAMLLGGIAAEEVVYGAYSDGAGGLPGSDLVVATDLATIMVCQLGFGGILASEVLNGHEDLHLIRMRRTDLAARVSALLRDEFERVQEIIVDHRAALDSVVSALIHHRALSGEQILEIIETSADVPRRRTVSKGRRKSMGSSS